MNRITEFSKAWQTILKAPAPDEGQWRIWYSMHTEDIIKEGLLQLFIKFKKMGGKMDDEHKVRFLSAVLNRLSKERNNALNELKSLTVSSTFVNFDESTDYKGHGSAPLINHIMEDEDDSRFNR
jgi:hypothetical protein